MLEAVAEGCPASTIGGLCIFPGRQTADLFGGTVQNGTFLSR